MLVGNAVIATTIQVTRPNDTIAYTAGDVISTAVGDALIFANMARNLGAFICIKMLTIRIDASAIPVGMAALRVHLYNAPPTVLADNAAFDLPLADRDKYLGFIDAPTPILMGTTIWTEAVHSKTVKLAQESSTLYAVIQTIAGYTPTASRVKTVTIIAEQV